MNFVAKTGLFAAIIFSVVFVQAQSTVNLATLLYTAPVDSATERQDFRREFEAADVLGWLPTIREYAYEPTHVRVESKFKIAVAMELVAARASAVPLTDRSLARPTSPISVIEFFLLMMGPTAINHPVLKQFSIIQLGKECFVAASFSASEKLADERALCVEQVFPVILEAAKSTRIMTSTSARVTLAMLSAVYPSPARSGKSIADIDRNNAIAAFEKRAIDALDALKDYQNTVDRR